MSSTCVVTMANEHARSQYALALRSQECYARRHGYVYSQESVQEGMPRPSSYKPAAIRKWVDDARCKWIFWLDADVFIVQGERRLEKWLQHEDTLVLRDDHSVIGNPAFAIRANWWLAREFMNVWQPESAKAKWPLTDNGAMFEAMLQTFVPGYQTLSCCQLQGRGVGVPRTCALGFLVNCTMHALLRAFGRTQRAPRWRGGNGLRLVAPEDAFYGFGCTNAAHQQVHCNASARWMRTEYVSADYARPGHTLGYTKLLDYFTPPTADGSPTGRVGSTFALHAKTFAPLPPRVRERALWCESSADSPPAPSSASARLAPSAHARAQADRSLEQGKSRNRSLGGKLTRRRPTSGLHA